MSKGQSRWRRISAGHGDRFKREVAALQPGEHYTGHVTQKLEIILRELASLLPTPPMTAENPDS